MLSWSCFDPARPFLTREKKIAYLQELSSALSWIDQEPCSVVIADACVKDFPIVAASDQFLKATGCSESAELFYANCRFLVDNVSYADVFQNSKSARTALRSYSQHLSFPGTLDPDTLQPTLQDGRSFGNEFVVVRASVF